MERPFMLPGNITIHEIEVDEDDDTLVPLVEAPLVLAVPLAVESARGASRDSARDVILWAHRGEPGATILRGGRSPALVMEHQGVRYTLTAEAVRQQLLAFLDQRSLSEPGDVGPGKGSDAAASDAGPSPCSTSPSPSPVIGAGEGAADGLGRTR